MQPNFIRQRRRRQGQKSDLRTDRLSPGVRRRPGAGEPCLRGQRSPTTSQPAPSPVSCAGKGRPGGQRATPPTLRGPGCSPPGPRAPSSSRPRTPVLSPAPPGRGGPGASGPRPLPARAVPGTHRQDGAVPLHQVRQLLQQPAAARGVQPAPRRAPLEGGLCGLHRLVHVRLQGRTTERACHLSRRARLSRNCRVRPPSRHRGRRWAGSSEQSPSF